MSGPGRVRPADLWQAAILVLLVLAAGLALHNALDHLTRHGIGGGFGFLHQEAGFVLSQSLIDYQPSDSYARAYLVGLLNTLAVSAVGLVAATVLGVALGMARLSSNWLLSRLALLYVGLIRNTPLILQLFVIYAGLSQAAPAPRDAWAPLPYIFVSNRGVAVPALDLGAGIWILLALVLGVVASLGLRKRLRVTGWLPVLTFGPALAVWLVSGAHLAIDPPVKGNFNFSGGLMLSPEFAALALGLSLYTAAYIAEIVRAGILGVERGQVEAADALGLNAWQRMRFVVLPQALRAVVPPMTGQYLNLLKNSSLAIAIGYPDLVAVSDTQINQTGQAIEGVGLMMGLYLVICLAISWAMGRLNRPHREGAR